MMERVPEHEARQKAKDELFETYVKALMELYIDIIMTINDVKESTLHQKIMRDLRDLPKYYKFEKALKKAVEKNQEGFKTVVQVSEVSDEACEEEESSQ